MCTEQSAIETLSGPTEKCGRTEQCDSQWHSSPSRLRHIAPGGRQLHHRKLRCRTRSIRRTSHFGDEAAVHVCCCDGLWEVRGYWGGIRSFPDLLTIRTSDWTSASSPSLATSRWSRQLCRAARSIDASTYCVHHHRPLHSWRQYFDFYRMPARRSDYHLGLAEWTRSRNRKAHVSRECNDCFIWQ